MKKILISLICLLVAFVGRAQFNITQNLGSPNTLVKNPNYGGLQGGLIPFTFTDTSSANTLATALKTYSGALIYTTSPRAVWWRDAAVSQWIQVLPGGGTGALGAWTTTLNTTIPTDLSLNGYFGTTDANGIGFYTTNTQRVILPAGGLTLKAVVSDTTLNKPMVWNTSTKEWNYGYWYGGSGATPTWQQTLTAGSMLTGPNTVLAGNNTLIFDWGTLTDDGFEIASSSTTAAGDAQRLMLINLGGINANSGQETTALEVDNGHTGTTSTNIALKTGANGGASANIGLWVDRGISRFGTTSLESGQLDILGLTSGTISIKPQDAAGTWTMTLPTTDGNSGEFLQTDGSGVTTWAAPSVTASSTTTFTNKRWTARVGSTTSSATPTINTDNYDIYKLTAQTADITSMTTNLSGTPVDGDILEVQITGTAARAITWGASFVSSTVTLPTTTVTTATLTVILQYYSTSSYGNNKWVCVNYY